MKKFRTIDDYGDCEVLKPGEVWKSARVVAYKVESVDIGKGAARVRNLASNKTESRPFNPPPPSWVRAQAGPKPELGPKDAMPGEWGVKSAPR